MYFTPVIAASLSILLSTNSFAGDLSDMLQRMSDADLKQNYQGTFILRKSDNLSTLRVSHGSDDKGVWESLEALNGEPRKVIRRNNQVISVFPGRKLVTIRHAHKDQSLHPQLPANLDRLELFYTINRLDDDRIANHQTLVVDLSPKDKLRYGYRYWVDKKTGMLLRCDLVAEDKTVVEQMMFTSLDYLTQAPAQSIELSQFDQYEQQVFDEPKIQIKVQGVDGQSVAEQPVAEQQVGANKGAKTQWTVNRLPEGFMLTQHTMRYSQPVVIEKTNPSQKQLADLLHLVYSDGLASVSVFIEKNKGVGNHLQGVSTMGAINAFGNAVDGYFVTAVGEVPVRTVQSMAQSTVQSSLQSTLREP